MKHNALRVSLCILALAGPVQVRPDSQQPVEEPENPISSTAQGQDLLQGSVVL